MILLAKVLFWLIVVGLTISILKDKPTAYKVATEKTYESWLGAHSSAMVIDIVVAATMGYLIWGQQ